MHGDRDRPWYLAIGYSRRAGCDGHSGEHVVPDAVRSGRSSGDDQVSALSALGFVA